MGYSTDFEGELSFSRQLTTEEKTYIQNFNKSRRMKRDVEKLMQKHNGGNTIPNLHGEEVNSKISYLEKRGYTVTKNGENPTEIYGVDGGYFVESDHGQDGTIVEYNQPPDGQPSLWCQWTTNDDGTKLMWDGGEKFYSYVEWLKYLIEHFFKPWNVTLNGTIMWQGESVGDVGKIVVKNNGVTTKNFEIE
jgi:hypothetical protein